MNKTKRTLIISSIVMALAFIVTVVSVTAAWFSNVSSSKQDGFIIGSTTLKESATISIDTNVGGASDVSIWPAVVKKGYLAQGGVAPSGKTLKNTPNAVDNTLNSVDREAKTAVVYFPINFVGAPDSKVNDKGEIEEIDGRKSLQVNLNFASTEANLIKTEQYGKLVVTGTKKHVESAFNVELDMVSVVKNGDAYTITPIDMTGVNPKELSGTDKIYCNQPSLENGEPGYDLYLLVMPGETYYVRATIYFNQVDEEVDVELLYTSVFFNFVLEMTTDKTVRDLPVA